MLINRIFALLLLAGFACKVAEAEYKWEKSEQIGGGVCWTRCQADASGQMRITAVRVPLKNVAFTITGRCQDWGQSFDGPAGTVSLQNSDSTLIEPAAKRTKRETVTQFLRSMKEPVEKGGVNGQALFAFCGRGPDRPYYQDFADPEGIFIRDGQIISDDHRKREGVFVIRKNGAASIEKNLLRAEYDNVRIAISGKTRIRENGVCVVPASRNTPGPRIAIGLTADQSVMYVISADNGKTPQYGNGGATYSDLNDIFASFSVTDAIALDLGSATAIVINNPDGNGEKMLNPFDNGSDNSRNSINIGVYASTQKKPVRSSSWAEANKPAENKIKGPQEISANLTKPPLRVFKDRDANETVLKGQVRVSVSSRQPRFKRPVTLICALFDVNGLWQYCDVMLTDQKVSHGYCAQRSKPYTPKEVSSWQPEVTAKSWTNLVLGDSKTGFFHGYHISKDAKLICWRVEVWQNQGLVASCDSDLLPAKLAGVPEDWYLKNKYPGKITYYWTPENK